MKYIAVLRNPKGALNDGRIPCEKVLLEEHQLALEDPARLKAVESEPSYIWMDAVRQCPVRQLTHLRIPMVRELKHGRIERRDGTQGEYPKVLTQAAWFRLDDHRVVHRRKILLRRATPPAGEPKSISVRVFRLDLAHNLSSRNTLQTFDVLTWSGQIESNVVDSQVPVTGYRCAAGIESFALSLVEVVKVAGDAGRVCRGSVENSERGSSALVVVKPAERPIIDQNARLTLNEVPQILSDEQEAICSVKRDDVLSTQNVRRAGPLPQARIETGACLFVTSPRQFTRDPATLRGVPKPRLSIVKLGNEPPSDSRCRAARVKDLHEPRCSITFTLRVVRPVVKARVDDGVLRVSEADRAKMQQCTTLPLMQGRDERPRRQWNAEIAPIHRMIEYNAHSIIRANGHAPHSCGPPSAAAKAGTLERRSLHRLRVDGRTDDALELLSILCRTTTCCSTVTMRQASTIAVYRPSSVRDDDRSIASPQQLSLRSCGRRIDIRLRRQRIRLHLTG